MDPTLVVKIQYQRNVEKKYPNPKGNCLTGVGPKFWKDARALIRSTNINSHPHSQPKDNCIFELQCGEGKGK